MKKNLVVAVVLFAVVFLVGGCSNKKVITMGTNATFPPFEYYENDEVVGLDIEISKKIAEKLGCELVVTDMDFEGLLTALSADKIDFVAAGMTIDSTRLESADFSDEYYEANQVIIVMENNSGIASVEDLVGKKIGVQIGTTGADKAKEIKDAQVSEYNAAFQAILDMQNGKVDAVIIDNEPAKNFARENNDIKILPEPLTIENYAIAVKKGNTELLDTINTVLREIKANGEFDKIIEKYLK